MLVYGHNSLNYEIFLMQNILKVRETHILLRTDVGSSFLRVKSKIMSTVRGITTNVSSLAAAVFQMVGRHGSLRDRAFTSGGIANTRLLIVYD